MSFWASLSNTEKQACVNNSPKPDRVLKVSSLSKVEVWRPIGRLNDEWIFKILPKITQVSNESYFSDQLFPKDQRHASHTLPVWSLYIVRKKARQEELIPTIFALHRDTAVAKKARKIFEDYQHGTLGPLLQGYQFGHAEYAVNLRADPEASHENSMDPPKESLTGKHVLITSVNGGNSPSERVWTHSTIGGSVLVNGRYYGLTTAHPFSAVISNQAKVENTAVSADRIPGKLDVPSDFSKTASEEQKSGKLSNFRVYAHGCDDIDEVLSDSSVIPTQHPDPSELINGVPGPSGARNGVVDPRIIYNTNHDWALVPIINPRFSTANSVSAGNGELLPVSGLTDRISSGRVLVGTSVSRREWTDFPKFASAIALPNSNRMHIVWSVQQQSLPGDSGSWVFDRDGRAFAMVVAGSDDGETFCLPLAPILENIQQQFGDGDAPQIVVESHSESAVKDFQPKSPPETETQNSLEEENEQEFLNQRHTNDLNDVGDADVEVESGEDPPTAQQLYRQPTVNEDIDDPNLASRVPHNGLPKEESGFRDDDGETGSRSEEGTQTIVGLEPRDSDGRKDKSIPTSAKGAAEGSHDTGREKEAVLVEHSEEYILLKNTINTEALRDLGFLFHKQGDYIVVTGKSLGTEGREKLSTMQSEHLPASDADATPGIQEAANDPISAAESFRTGDQQSPAFSVLSPIPAHETVRIVREEEAERSQHAKAHQGSGLEQQETPFQGTEIFRRTLTYDYDDRRPISHDREKSRGRNPSVDSPRELVIRREEPRGRHHEKEREEIIIRRPRSRRRSRERSPEYGVSIVRSAEEKEASKVTNERLTEPPWRPTVPGPPPLEPYPPVPPSSRAKRVSRRDIDPVSLDFYRVPWTMDAFDPEFLFVNDFLTKERWHELRMHTARLQKRPGGLWEPRPLRRYNSMNPFILDDYLDSHSGPSRSALVHRPAVPRRRTPKSVTIDEPHETLHRSSSIYREVPHETLHRSSSIYRDEPHVADPTASDYEIRSVCRRLDRGFESRIREILWGTGCPLDLLDNIMTDYEDKEMEIYQLSKEAELSTWPSTTQPSVVNPETSHTRESGYNASDYRHNESVADTDQYALVRTSGPPVGSGQYSSSLAYAPKDPAVLTRDRLAVDSMDTVHSRGTVVTID